MPAKESNERQPVAEVAVLLGVEKGGSPDAVTRTQVAALTQKQLVSASKKLGLAAVSKLKKDELAVQVWDAWIALLAEHGSGAGAGSGSGAGRTATAHSAQAAAPAAAAVATESAAETTTPRSHKFEVGEADRPASPEAMQLSRAAAREIPWGYGHDRVTAMAIDPDRFFAYWEVLDASIERARAQLGGGGSGAWLNLRVYDVTGRIFDGTNAHSNSDHRVERGDRQWFFPIGKPTSELIVEIGMKSDEGYFVRIARSSRVQFPRREPVAPGEAEWLTVRIASGHMERAGSGISGRPRPGAAAIPTTPTPMGAWEGTPRGGDGAAGHMRRGPANGIMLGAIPASAETTQWEEVSGDGALELHRQIRWEGPTVQTAWEAGPFPYPVEVPEPVRETLTSKTRVFRMGTQTHVVYGPWQVVIRGLGAETSRTVLSRWEVYRSWGAETGHEVEEYGSVSVTEPGGASERMVGSSGRRWVGSSELRFAGASEQYFLKASELRLGGSSERLYGGASEWRARGASERRLGGGSEWVARGSSERLFAGGSDRWSRAGLPGGPVPGGPAPGGPAPGVLSAASPAGNPAAGAQPSNAGGASAYPSPPSGSAAGTPSAPPWRKGP